MRCCAIRCGPVRADQALPIRRKVGRVSATGSTRCLNRSNRPARFRYSRCQIAKSDSAPDKPIACHGSPPAVPPGKGQNYALRKRGCVRGGRLSGDRGCQGYPHNLQSSIARLVFCTRPMLAVLAIGTSLLTACVTVASDPRVATVCPPVVEYSREFQARATDELGFLPEGSATADMLSDYGVMRVQVRTCEV